MKKNKFYCVIFLSIIFYSCNYENNISKDGKKRMWQSISEVGSDDTFHLSDSILFFNKNKLTNLKFGLISMPTFYNNFYAAKNLDKLIIIEQGDSLLSNKFITFIDLKNKNLENNYKRMQFSDIVYLYNNLNLSSSSKVESVNPK